MHRCMRAMTVTVLSILWGGISASAETMRCQSVNGNLNCAGSGGVSCQTINGKKVCVSGHGEVVQSFGAGTSSHSSNMDTDDGAADGDDGPDSAPPAPRTREHLEQRGPRGRVMQLDRNGTELHLRTGRMTIDRN